MYMYISAVKGSGMMGFTPFYLHANTVDYYTMPG